MLRWLTRLAVGALVIALLVWLWSRYNEDLEEEEFEEEIPLEFEVSADNATGLPPLAVSGDAGNGIADYELAPDPALVTDITAFDGEEDDATVPPRMGERSQGAQEGYSPAEREATLEAPPPGAGDNLEVIKGIGPKYAAQLAEMGITTFGALINTPMDELVIAFPRVSEGELQSWIDQAHELAESNP